MSRFSSCGKTEASRRAVITALGSVLFAAALPGAAAGREALVPGGIVNSESALAIGRAAQAAGAVERDAGELVLALFPSSTVLSQHPARLRTALATQIRADFAAGDMVTVQGWALSRTETRLCVLIALEHNRSDHTGPST